MHLNTGIFKDVNNFNRFKGVKSIHLEGGVELALIEVDFDKGENNQVLLPLIAQLVYTPGNLAEIDPRIPVKTIVKEKGDLRFLELGS